MPDVRGHNEGTVYQRKDGRWVAVISLPGGRRRSRYAPDRDSANAELAELLRLRDAGAPTKRLTLSAFLQGWLADMAGTVRPATLDHYANIVDNHLIPAMGAIRIGRLTPADVTEYLRAKGATLSPRTVRHHRAVLRNALNAAAAMGAVSRNAAGMARPPRLADRPPVRALTADQVDVLLSATAGDRLHALYVLAATTGLRQAELLGLAWDDVSLSAATIRVRSTLHRVGGEWRMGDPKTENAHRTVPLTTRAVAALTEHKRAMALERKPDWKYHGMVFVTPRGRPIHGPNLLPPFYAYLAALGLPRVTWHGLRHSTASVLISAGVPLPVVSRILGHSTIRVTFDLYSHLDDAVLREAADGMDRALSEASAARSAVTGKTR